VGAYQKPAPKHIVVDVVYADAKGVTNTLLGHLLLQSLPVVRDGKPGGIGIKDLVPKNPGEVWIVKAAGAPKTPPEFVYHGYDGDQAIRLGFESLPVVLNEDAEHGKLMDRRDDLTWTTGNIDDAEAIAGLVDGGAAVPGGITSAAADTNFPVRLGVFKMPAFDTIPVGWLWKIVFREAAGDYEREVPTGRFVQYSNAAKGDEGRIQVTAATFFGGTNAEERFEFGDFLPGGSVLVGGNFAALDFAAAGKPVVLGNDPAADAYPDIVTTDSRGRTRVDQPRRTPVLVQFSPKLDKVVSVVRLPWAAGTAGGMTLGADGAVYLTLAPGPHVEGLAGAIPKTQVVENPGAVEYAKQKQREPGPDTLVLRLAPDRARIDWAVRFKHTGVAVHRRPDGGLLVKRYADLFFIKPDGTVDDGPKLETSHSMLAVSPVDGSMYFGGDYHSGTGREPYRNPWLRKVGADGKLQWTAYDWTGPVVGTDRFRLVSDSSIRDARVGQDGNLILKGWSDGGNSVLCCQPYDLRKGVDTDSFAGSIWGAGALSVSYFLLMDAETMHVSGGGRFQSYLPYSDRPNSIFTKDYGTLASGDVAFTGSSAMGLIETWDAWVTPWYVEYRTNEYARCKGGAFFAIFTPDFKRLRFSSVVPGADSLGQAIRGETVLLYGACQERHSAYGHTNPALVKNALQAGHGGGRLDAYVMLIDTAGKPTPPTIPEKTWK
jgi:hypothetical protein